MEYATIPTSHSCFALGLNYWEYIRCPRCGLVQWGLVKHLGNEYRSHYLHECMCGYIITESEWEQVQ